MQYRHSIYLIHQGGQSQARLILACMGAPSKRHQKPHTQSIKPYRLIFPGLHYLQSYCWIQDCIYSIPFLDQSVFFLTWGGMSILRFLNIFSIVYQTSLTYVLGFHLQVLEEAGEYWHVVGLVLGSYLKLHFFSWLFLVLLLHLYIIYMSYLKIMLLAGDVSLFCTSWSAYSLKGKFC